MEPDIAITGTDQGVPAPAQTLPPTVPQDTQNPSPSAQVESTPLGNATGVSNPPDEVINTSQDSGPQPQLQSQPVGSTVLPPRTPMQAPPGSMQTPAAPKGVDPGNPNANHPAVQRAGLFHTIAEALAGGPRYAVKVNPMTGETERTRLPMSGGAIAGAIALEALGGAAAGLGAAPGPGNLGRAAAAGYGQISQEQQAARDRQTKEASDDFARHARVLETNLQMHNSAQQVGKQTLENNQAYVAQYAELADKIQKDYPQAAKDIVPESRLSEYHATKDNAIPVKVVPRLDKDGHQASDEYGTPQWDIDYLVVDPKFKAEDLLTQDDKDAAAHYHLQGFVGADGKPTKLPTNLMLSLGMVTNYKAQIAALKLADQDLNESYDTINSRTPTGYQYNTGSVNVPNDQHQADQLDSTAEKYSVPKAVLRSIAMQESGGRQVDPKTGQPIASGTGPTGIMQIAKSTAKTYGGDPADQGQNIDMAGHYLSDLIKKHSGDLNAALTEYGGGDKAVPGYANQVLGRAGVASSTGTKTVDTSGTVKAPDLSAALAANPALKQYLKEFQPYRVNSKDSLEEAIHAYGAKNPDGAAKITQLYGGDDAVRQIDQTRGLNLQAQKDALSESKTQANAKAKQDLDREVGQEKESVLQGPDNWHFDPAVANFDDPEDASKYLASKGVTVPLRFDSLWAIAHNRQALTSNAARVWLKGNEYETDQGWASAYIHKFINPDYNEAIYDSNKNEIAAMRSDKPNTPGGTLQNAGTATQHMQLMLSAAKNLPNFSLDDSHSLQVLNNIATEIGTKTGNSAAIVFQGIRDQMAAEVAKVSQGGQPTEQEIKNVQTLLEPYNSPAQIKDLIGAYSHLMAGRLRTMENNYYTKIGDHITVDPMTTQIFQNYGIGTPWINTPRGHNKPMPSGSPVIGQYALAAGKLPQGTYDLKANPNGWNLDEMRRLMARDGWVLNQSQQQPSGNQVAQGGQ